MKKSVSTSSEITDAGWWTVASGYVRWAAAAFTVFALLWSLNRGFEFGDEAFYLYYMYRFDDMTVSVTPFGFVLEPVFRLLGSSILAMRAAGLLMLVTCGMLLGAVLTRLYAGNARWDRGQNLLLAVPLANLGYYAFWVMTPGYNLLILTAFEIVFAGALLGSLPPTGRYTIGGSGLLIGLGAFLAFFAKPTAALLCAVAIIPLCWHWLRTQGWRPVAVRLGVAVGVLAAFATAALGPGGRAAKFIGETRGGLTYLKLGNSPAELVLKTGVDLYRASSLFWIAATALVVTLVLAPTASARGRSRLVAVATLMLGLAFLLLNLASSVLQRESPFSFVFLPMTCIAIGAILIVYTDRLGGEDHRRDLIVPAVLLLAPCLLSFGSSIPIFVQSGMYVPLTLIGLTIVVGFMNRGTHRAVGEVMVALTVPLLIVWSMTIPFHQPDPIFADDTRVTVGPGDESLLVSPRTAGAIDTIRAAGERYSVDRRTPVVDLTGTGPGVTLLLGGRAPFYPWLITSVGRPLPLADETWKHMQARERKDAWIIGPVDPSLIPSIAARDFVRNRRNYRLVARTELPLRPSLSRMVEIWRPIGKSGPDQTGGEHSAMLPSTITS